MSKSVRQMSRIGHLSTAAVSLAVFLAGCAAAQSPATSSTSAGDASSKVPRLTKRDSVVVWENAAAFGKVPSELQARGDEVCNTGASKRMKATGYHTQAQRLDGTPFPRGGFLCAEDNAPPAPAPVVEAPAPKPEPKPVVTAVPAGPNLADINARTQNWAKAWASKDLNAYFGFYSTSFKPGGFANLAAWKDARQIRISKAGNISIEISNVSSKVVSGGAVETQFTQKYSSPGFKDVSDKTLLWANEGGQWKIVSESNR